MKKTILIAVAVVAIVTATYAAVSIKQTGAGLFIGTKTTDAIGAYGVTPVAQQTGPAALTNGAQLAECVTAINAIRSNLVASGWIK